MSRIDSFMNLAKRKTGIEPGAGIVFGKEEEHNYQDITQIRDAAQKLLSILNKYKEQVLPQEQKDRLETLVQKTQDMLTTHILAADNDPQYISPEDRKFLIDIRDSIKYAFGKINNPN